MKIKPIYKNTLQGKTKNVAALFTAGFLLTGFPVTKAYAENTTGPSQLKHAAVVMPSMDHKRNKTFMKRRWGVEVLFVRQTSAGYMLEFRYKVLDANKAHPLFKRQTKPVMTHYKTGAKLIVPTPAKTGALRNSNLPKAGHSYWMFFANPAKLVKQGDTVGITIGKFEVADLVVQ